MRWRHLMRWLAPVVLAVASLPTAWAQGPQTGPLAPPAPAQPGEDKQERPAPALQYTVALLSALLILTIICKPSRKS